MEVYFAYYKSGTVTNNHLFCPMKELGPYLKKIKPQEQKEEKKKRRRRRRRNIPCIKTTFKQL
jgi:hypothetical protein